MENKTLSIFLVLSKAFHWNFIPNWRTKTEKIESTSINIYSHLLMNLPNELLNEEERRKYIYMCVLLSIHYVWYNNTTFQIHTTHIFIPNIFCQNKFLKLSIFLLFVFWSCEIGNKRPRNCKNFFFFSSTPQNKYNNNNTLTFNIKVQKESQLIFN